MTQLFTLLGIDLALLAVAPGTGLPLAEDIKNYWLLVP